MARRRIIANVKPTVAFLCLGLSLGLIQPNLKTETTPPADITITGEGGDDDFGWHVAPAGDVNGDGIPDLIVGAPSNDAVPVLPGVLISSTVHLPETSTRPTPMRSSPRKHSATTLDSPWLPAAM